MQKSKNGAIIGDLAYGFSRYVLLEKRGLDINLAILYTTSALESIGRQVIRHLDKTDTKPDKNTIKQEINEVKEYLAQFLEGKSIQVKKFYLKDTNAIYDALCRKNAKDGVLEAANRIGVECSKEQQEAIDELFKAKNQITHGRDYRVLAAVEELFGYNCVRIEDEGENLSYSFGWEDGYINLAIRLITEIGRKYYSMD